MKILYLGPAVGSMITFLQAFEDEVVSTEEPINPESDFIGGVDIIVSYEYRPLLEDRS